MSRLNGVPLRISLKCDPGLAIQLRTSYASITGGYHLNKRHWNTVVLDGSVPDQLLRDMIGRSRTLRLRVAGADRKVLLDLAGMLAVRSVHFLYRRRESIPL